MKKKPKQLPIEVLKEIDSLLEDVSEKLIEHIESYFWMENIKEQIRRRYCI